MLILGEMVHYVVSGNKHRPAFVIEVGNGESPTIYCMTMPDENGAMLRADCPHDETSKGEDTWHYPEI